jgi:hypothetical protein
MPRILLVPAPLGLCAQERSLSSSYNLASLGPPHHIKIGVANSYICLTLLKQIWIICDPSAVSPYPRHFWFVGRAANWHTKHYGHDAG